MDERDNVTTQEATDAIKKAGDKDFNDPVWDVIEFMLNANPNIKEEVKEMSTAYERVCQMLAGDRIATATAVAREEAREEERKNIARFLLKKGGISVDEIVEATKLDLNTVLHLQGE